MTEQTDQTQNTPDVTPPSSSGEGATPSFFDAIMESAGPSSGSDEQPQDQVQTAQPGDQPPGDTAPAPEGSTQEDQTAQSAQADDKSLKDEVDEDGSDDLDVLTEKDLKHMSERNKRRFDKLLAERKAAREEAMQARPIVEFLQKNDIPMQDVDVILGLAAQLRHGDFAGFLRTITPYVQLAQQYTGEILPPDLKKQVDDGLVSPAVARELAHRRAQQTFQNHQAQRQQVQSQQEVRNLQAQVIRSAVVEWERQTKAADPDFEAKMGVARRAAQALILERGAPRTPEQAVAYAKAAYDEAGKIVQTFRPKTPTPRTPSSTQQSTPPSRPEPKSMLDVVRQNVGGA